MSRARGISRRTCLLAPLVGLAWPGGPASGEPSPVLPRFRAAREAVSRGVRNARLVCLGDSTSWGYGAAGRSFGGDLRGKAWPAKLAGLLPGGSHQSFFGNGDRFRVNRYTGADGADARIDAGAWVPGDDAVAGLGQYPYTASAPGAPFAFAPGAPFDTVEVYHLTDPAGGPYGFDVSVGGVPVGRIEGGRAEGFRRTVLAAPRGTGAIRCDWRAGSCFLSGMIASDSARKEISVVNAAAASAKIVDLAAPPSAARAYGPLNALAALAPDLAILDMTINDGNFGTDLADYGRDVAAVVARLRAAGADVLMVTGNPSDPREHASPARQQRYVDAFKRVAAGAGVPVVDVFAAFGSFDAARGRGLMADGVHPNDAGYALIAAMVAAPLLAG